MEEAEKICSQVLILDKGLCLAQGSTNDLIGSTGKYRNLHELFLKTTGK
jgi:ABC-type multidrug transport system ATPase subunit